MPLFQCCFLQISVLFLLPEKSLHLSVILNFFVWFFFSKNHALIPENSIFRSIFLPKTAETKIYRKYPRKNRQPKKLHLSVIFNCRDCNCNRKTIDFYRKYSKLKSIFHAEILETRLVRTLGKYYLQLPSKVNFSHGNIFGKKFGHLPEAQHFFQNLLSKKKNSTGFNSKKNDETSKITS